MAKRFRALRALALLYRIVAWVVLVGGVLAALLVAIISAIQARVGTPSPLLADLPILGDLVGPLAGVLAGIVMLVVALLQFLLFHAANEVIELGLAIEHNTRETAYYLRGEHTLPPPPVAVSWDQPETPEPSS